MTDIQSLVSNKVNTRNKILLKSGVLICIGTVDIFSTLGYPKSYKPRSVNKPDTLRAINYLMNYYPINTVINNQNFGPLYKK